MKLDYCEAGIYPLETYGECDCTLNSNERKYYAFILVRFYLKSLDFGPSEVPSPRKVQWQALKRQHRVLKNLLYFQLLGESDFLL